MSEIKIETGADFKRWLIAMGLVGIVVLAAAGGLVYHKITTAAAEKKEKDYIREVGIEGTPVLVGVTGNWFAKGSKKEENPGLKLTPIMIKGLDLRTEKVVKAQSRPLPPQIGTLNYDAETMFLLKCRFAGELKHIMQIKDRAFTTDPPYEKVIDRPIKFGDKVKQGDVLAVFWSVTLGTAKAAFVDAISAGRLSQDAYQRQLKLYKEGGLPLGTLKAAERQLQGDNNNLLTCERTLRMYNMNTDEIEALRKEANDILDATLIDPSGRISTMDDTGMTLVLTSEDKEGRSYKFAKECKFLRVIKRDQTEEIKGGPRADVFKDVFKKLSKKGIGASIMTNLDGDVTEVVIGKERDVLAEVNRWARTEVYVPKFDKANPDRPLTIVEKNTHIGDFVDSTNFSTWLFRVADMSKLAIWVHPSEEYLPLIREGMKKRWTTDGTLDKLRRAHWLDDSKKEQRVPDEVVDKVARIPPKKFDQEEFTAELQKVLNPAEIKEYQQRILVHTRKDLMWEIRMKSDPSARPITAPVDLICPSLEPNQHNPMVLGYLPNDEHKFLAGQFVTATLQMPPEENTMEIPTVAVNEYNGQSFVFVQGKAEGEYFIRRVAVVRRYAEYTVVRSADAKGKLRPQDEKYSDDELKAGRYPLRPLASDDEVVTHGVVELTIALETLLTKESIKHRK